MADGSTKLSEAMVRERLMSDQSARELAPLLTTNQRALLSLLATAELYQLDLKTLLLGFAEESKMSIIKEFAERLTPESDPIDVIGEFAALMPKTCQVALNSSRASGTLSSFYRSWLSQSVDERVNWVQHENTTAALIGRLVVRTVICVWLLSFITLFVIPEHQKMYEEFGIEYNGTATTFLWALDLCISSLPWLFIVGACVCIYIVCFRISIIKGYFRRWFPGKWRQVVLPKSILQRKLMAWDLLAFRGISGAEGVNESPRTDWDALVASRQIGSREADVMKSASCLETQAWLLRNMTDKKLEARKSRTAIFVTTVSVLFQAVLAALIILATFSMFSMMVDLMRSLA